MIYLYVNDAEYINGVIDEVEVVPVFKKGKWWIIPNNFRHDETFNTCGPYDDPEEAVMMLRLLATRYETYGS